jgi:hypothetical protein
MDSSSLTVTRLNRELAKRGLSQAGLKAGACERPASSRCPPAELS